MDHLEHLGVNDENLTWAPIEEFEVWETWQGRIDIKTQEGMSVRRVKGDQISSQLQDGTLFRGGHIHQPKMQLLVAPQILYRDERKARRIFREGMEEGELPFQANIDKAKGLPFDKGTYEKVAKELGIPLSYCLHFHRKNSVPFLMTTVPGKETGWKGFICQTPFLTNSDFFISLAVSYNPETFECRGLLHFVLDHPRYDALRHYIFATRHLVQHPLLLPIIIFTVADTHNRQQCQHVDKLVQTSFATSSLRQPSNDANLDDFSRSLRDASKQLELLQWCQTTISSALPDFLQNADEQISAAFCRPPVNPSRIDPEVTEELKEFFENIRVGMESQIPTTRDRLELQIQHVVSRIQHEETQISLRRAQYGKQDAAAISAITIITMVFLPATALASILSMELFFKGTHDGSRVRISKSFWIFLAITVPLTLFVIGGWMFGTVWRDRPASLASIAMLMRQRPQPQQQQPPQQNLLQQSKQRTSTRPTQKFFIKKNAWKAGQGVRDSGDEESRLLPTTRGQSSPSVHAPSDGRQSYTSLHRSSPSYGTASRPRDDLRGQRQ